MAGTHNQLARGQVNDAIKVALGLTRDEANVERLGETLVPYFDIWKLPEYAYLRREALWAHSITQTAVVGELSQVAVVNPASSNLIVVLEQASGGGNNVNVRLTDTVALSDITATLTLAAVAQVRDQRWWGSILVGFTGYQTRVQIWNGSSAATLGGIQQEKIAFSATATSPFFSMPYVIRPGCAVLFEATTSNLGLDLNFGGRVRSALPGELPGA